MAASERPGGGGSRVRVEKRSVIDPAKDETIGALILQMINTGIVILGINQNYSQIIIGAVVIVAVVLDQFNNWLAQRRLTKSS